MTRILRLLPATLLCLSLAACGDDEDAVTISLFRGAPDAIELGQSTKLVFVVDPADARISISEVGDVTGKVEASVTPAATTTYRITATKGNSSATANAVITVGPTTAAAIKVEPASAEPIAGDSLSVTVTAIVGNGTTAPGFRGTVKLTSSDPQAVLPPDLVFTAADAGVKQVKVTLKTAGLSTLTGTDVATPTRRGTASVTVQHAAASTFVLSTLESPAVAGQSLVLTIAARDAFGNLATTFAGQSRVVSTDATDVLPGAGGFTAGVRTVSVVFRKAGTHVATVEEVGGTIPSVDTNAVAVGPAAPFRIALAAVNATTIAGTPEAFTATVHDFFDNVVTNYLGTVHFATTASADLPADYTFQATDAGSQTFSATLKTAGLDTITVSDVANAALSGFNSWLVGPAAAARCTVGQAPASARAGSVVGVAVTLHDVFDNQATTYTGTIRLTATDVRATLPADVTYQASDAGSHAFSASLRTAGTQTLSAEDVADATIHCDAQIAILPGAARLALTVPSDANAGFGVDVGVAVTDEFNNPITDYAGTVTFASTDGGAGAVTPAPITFTGSEGGVATTSATFVTLGAQTLTAADNGDPVASGGAAATVHGLVYTAPTSGKVRLVANPTQSNSQVVQLDLIANERIEVSSFFGGGPGPNAAGMNLPLDTTRAVADATLFTAGNAFLLTPAGNPPIPPVGIGRIGETDHVLYTAVSRRRVPGTVFTQENEVLPGRVFFSIRLRLTQTGTVGPVFDGSQPSPLFRAAVRDQYGDDFVAGSQFGIGRLEIR